MYMYASGILKTLVSDKKRELYFQGAMERLGHSYGYTKAQGASCCRDRQDGTLEVIWFCFPTLSNTPGEILYTENAPLPSWRCEPSRVLSSGA